MNNYLNFDHMGKGLITLFITSTLDGYSDVLQLSMAARGPDLQPIPGSNPSGFFFICVFIMVCAFCLLNLFRRRGVLPVLAPAAAQPCRHRHPQCQPAGVDRAVQGGVQLKPLPVVWVPTNRVRRFCHHVCQHDLFTTVMAVFILTNVGFMAMEHHNMGQTVIGACVLPPPPPPPALLGHAGLLSPPACPTHLLSWRLSCRPPLRVLSSPPALF